MREIKFRVWNKYAKEFVNDGRQTSLMSLLGISKYIYDYSILPDYLVFQQFTGLKDKNGKEIYEGDILRVPENNPESTSCHELVLVEYKYSGFGYVDTLTKRFDSIYSIIGDCDKDDCAEVIGNIFENPDLTI